MQLILQLTWQLAGSNKIIYLIRGSLGRPLPLRPRRVVALMSGLLPRFCPLLARGQQVLRQYAGEDTMEVWVLRKIEKISIYF